MITMLYDKTLETIYKAILEFITGNAIIHGYVDACCLPAQVVVSVSWHIHEAGFLQEVPRVHQR